MNKKSLRAVCVSVFCSLLLIGFFIIALQQKNIQGFVTAGNMNARNQYVMLTSDDIRLENHADIPAEGTVYLTGECFDFQYYKVYANDFFPQDTVIYGKEAAPDGYWGIQITDGSITAAWFSFYPLTTDQLHPYTKKEQLKSARFFDKSSTTHIIGYYSAP